MPPRARAAFMAPSPSGPTRRISRARLGSSAWWENPMHLGAGREHHEDEQGAARSHGDGRSTTMLLPQPTHRACAGLPAGADVRRIAAAPAR